MKRKELRFNLILTLVLAAEILISMYFTYKYGVNNVDADNSSEMVLSNLLASEGGFLSRNWFYSTELRVINTQIVLSLLFRVFDSWQLVRTLGSGILMAVMACTYLYMVHEAGLGRKGKVSAVLLLMPFCHCYQQFVLFGLYYIPHISISFLTIGLFIGSLKKNKLWRIKAALNLLLALAAGLGGIRMLVVLYCPLLLGSAAYCLLKYLKEKTVAYGEMIMPAAMALAAGVGYVLNSSVLSDIFTFKSFNGTEFSNPDIFGRSDMIINGILSFCGYKEGRRVIGPGIIANGLALLLFIFLIFMIVKLIKGIYDYSRNEQLVVCFFGATFSVNMFTFYFADMWETNGNYLIPFMIWMIPLFAVYFNHTDIKQRFAKCAMTLVACTFVLNSAMVYSEWQNTDINSGKEGIIKYLLNNGYERGYADFWDANVFTELSDGKLSMCNLRTIDESFSALEWLMDKRYTEWDEDSKVFIIVDNAFSWENRDTLSYLNREYMVAQNADYCVFAFENDAQLARIVEEGKHRQ